MGAEGEEAKLLKSGLLVCGRAEGGARSEGAERLLRRHSAVRRPAENVCRIPWHGMAVHERAVDHGATMARSFIF